MIVLVRAQCRNAIQDRQVALLDGLKNWQSPVARTMPLHQGGRGLRERR
jgi:hypothetical protein